MLLSLPLVGEEEAMEHHLLMEGEEGEGSIPPPTVWWSRDQHTTLEAKVEVPDGPFDYSAEVPSVGEEAGWSLCPLAILLPWLPCRGAHTLHVRTTH